MYIDTSVLVALYAPEPRSERAEAVVTRIEGPAISWLGEVEMASALARKVRTGELQGSSAAIVLAEFQKHVSVEIYRVLPVEPEDYALARRWLGSFRSPLRTLDAMHLAIASRAG